MEGKQIKYVIIEHFTDAFSINILQLAGHFLISVN